jgi:hypothetical protein
MRVRPTSLVSTSGRWSVVQAARAPGKRHGSTRALTAAREDASRRLQAARASRTARFALAVLLVVSPAIASAQSSFTWRARATDEAASEQPNATSPFLAPDRSDAWLGSNDFVASVDSTWDWQHRVKFGGGVTLRAPSDDGPDLRVREGYARASLLPWLDVEAGKRLVRWGTGYAFTPTGLLDPPRNATDPQDHLGLNEGMVMARLEAFTGSTAITLAAAAPRLDRPNAIAGTAPRRLLALRVRTTVGGVELAAVASAADGRRASFGGNFTHVVGRRLEYHGELLVHDDESPWRPLLAPHDAPARHVSALLGCQYTFNPGINAIVEYYRDGNGLSAALWSRLMDVAGTGSPSALAAATATMSGPGGSSSSSSSASGGGGTNNAALGSGSALNRPTRSDFLFVRASRANTEALFTPELIALVGLDDGGLTLVPTLRVAPTRHVQFYTRGVLLSGPARSADGSAPVAATISAGMTVLF